MTFWERVTGKVVDAAGLGQKKRAVATGLTAFDDPISDLRLDIAIKSHQWLQDTATTTFFLAVWLARALQDMAAILESTAQKQVGEAGKLPEATFALADRLYGGALYWIERAQSAQAAIEASRVFDLSAELPARPPRLDWIADASPAHFVAVIQSVVQLGTSAEDALNGMQEDRSRLPRKYDGAFDAIGGELKVARAKLDQVQAAESDKQAVRLSRDIWNMLQEVVNVYFWAGQAIARPALVDPRYDAAAAADARARRLPPPPPAQQPRIQPPPAQPTPAQPPPAQPPPAQPSWVQPPPVQLPPAQPPWVQPPPVQLPPAQPPWVQQPSPSGSPAPPAGPGRSPVEVGHGSAPRGMPQSPSQPPAPPPAPPTLSQRLGLSFDAWSLTDHGARSTYRNDPARIAELEAFWRTDTNPAESYRLFGLIEAAIGAGQVAVRPGEFAKACPWISIFVAMADVLIGTEQFAAGAIFTLNVGMEGDYFGRGFERLGFLPGAQQPRRKAPDVSGPPRLDTQFRGERKPRASRTSRADEDLWRLTAAFQRPQRRARPADVQALRELWRADPDPARTFAIHDELLAAVRAGNVRPHGDEALRDCPWSQVYVAVSKVAVGGIQLERSEKFALQVGVTGGTFRRGIIRLGSVERGR